MEGLDECLTVSGTPLDPQNPTDVLQHQLHRERVLNHQPRLSAGEAWQTAAPAPLGPIGAAVC